MGASKKKYPCNLTNLTTTALSWLWGSVHRELSKGGWVYLFMFFTFFFVVSGCKDTTFSHSQQIFFSFSPLSHHPTTKKPTICSIEKKLSIPSLTPPSTPSPMLHFFENRPLRRSRLFFLFRMFEYPNAIRGTGKAMIVRMFQSHGCDWPFGLGFPRSPSPAKVGL